MRGIEGTLLGEDRSVESDEDACGEGVDVSGDLPGIFMQLAVNPDLKPNDGASKEELACIADIAYHIKF